MGLCPQVTALEVWDKLYTFVTTEVRFEYLLDRESVVVVPEEQHDAAVACLNYMLQVGYLDYWREADEMPKTLFEMTPEAIVQSNRS